VTLISSTLIDCIQLADLTPSTSHHPRCKSRLHPLPTTTQRCLQRPHLLGRDSLGRMSLRDRHCVTRLQQHSTTPLYSPTLDTFHTGSDSLESTLTELADLCYNQLPRIFRKKPQAHQNPFFFHTLTRSFPCPFLYSIEPHSMENLSQP